MTAQRATIERAGRALVDAVAGSCKVVVFGPLSQDGTDDGSDYNFLVIADEVDDCFAEMARLSRILGRMLIPADVVVVSRQQADELGAVAGTLIHEALSKGRVVAKS